jgi:hypothetical protein
MNTTARHFTMNSTDSHERSHAAMGRPVMTCQWKLSREGQITGRWVHESRAPDAEHCASMSAHPSADDSQDEAQLPGRLRTVISRIAIGALLAISVCGTLVCFATEPGGLF